jgi:hypothetical protein
MAEQAHAAAAGPQKLTVASGATTLVERVWDLTCRFQFAYSPYWRADPIQAYDSADSQVVSFSRRQGGGGGGQCSDAQCSDADKHTHSIIYPQRSRDAHRVGRVGLQTRTAAFAFLFCRYFAVGL